MTYFTPYIDDFINLRVINGFNKKTYYRLKHFDKFILEHHPKATELTEAIVREWAKKRSSENHIGHTKRVIHIRLFARYMVSLGFPAYVLPMNSSSRKTDYVTYVISDPELAALINIADNIKFSKSNPFRHEELPVMLKLMYCCGLRPGECRGLKSNDVNLPDGVLLIRNNKSKSDRYVPMSPSITELCNKYMEKLQNYMPNSEFFFPNPEGKLYTAEWLKTKFKKLWLTAYPGSKAPVRAYSLRHRFATSVMMKWLNEGVDINANLFLLSTYMGHSNLNATAYYIHLLPENLIHSSAIDWSYFNSLIPEVDQ